MPEALGWGLIALVPGPLAPPQRARHKTASARGSLGLCTAWSQPSACVGTPAAQDHGAGSHRGLALAFANQHLAVVVPSLQRSFGPNPCRFVPAGFRSHGGRLSGSLSGFQFLGTRSGTGRRRPLSPVRRDLHPLLLQPCPTALSPRTQKDAPLSARPSGSARGRLCLLAGQGARAWLLGGRQEGWASLPQQAVWPCLWAADPGPTLPVAAQSPSLAWPGRGGVHPHFTDENTEAAAGSGHTQPRVPARF